MDIIHEKDLFYIFFGDFPDNLTSIGINQCLYITDIGKEMNVAEVSGSTEEVGRLNIITSVITEDDAVRFRD